MIFEYIFSDIGNSFYFNGYDYRFTPAPRPTLFDIISDNVKEINNEKFYNTGYNYPTPTSAPSTTTAIIFNGIVNGLSKNDILKGVFSVDCNKYVFDNAMNNEICNGMCTLYFYF